jgi:transketolase
MSTNLRDVFWNRIYQQAKYDHNIIIVSADLGAFALDQYRAELPGQFVNVGIAEQNAVAVAAGLCLEGKKVYVYANAPFVYLRCLDIIRQTLSMMNLPVIVVGQGAGFSFASYGASHYNLEDISAMRMLPNMKMYNLSDPIMTEVIAAQSLVSSGPQYIRVDKLAPKKFYASSKQVHYEVGFSILTPGKKLLLIATGNTVVMALEACEQLRQNGVDCGVMDLYCMEPDKDSLLSAIDGYANLISVEEHTASGGLGSMLCEIMIDNYVQKPLKRIAVFNKDGYEDIHGDRANIENHFGISVDQIIADAEELLHMECSTCNTKKLTRAT